jgi:hypothetical protein
MLVRTKPYLARLLFTLALVSIAGILACTGQPPNPFGPAASATPAATQAPTATASPQAVPTALPQKQGTNKKDPLSKLQPLGGAYLPLGGNPIPSSDSPGYSPVTQGLVGWWGLNEKSGTVAEDSSGNNDGAYIVNPLHGVGVVRGAMSNPSGWVEVPDDSSLNFGKVSGGPVAFTIDAWIIPGIKTTPKSIGLPVVFKEDSVGGYSLGSSPDGMSLRVATSYGVFNETSVSFRPAGEYAPWRHIAMVFDSTGSSITFYQDGAPLPMDGSAAGSAMLALQNGDLDSQSPLFIGSNGSTSGRGQLDEVEIYNRALSATEISSLYLSGPVGKCRSA